ncbi:MAG: hypothetical protein M3036_05725, partial [Bifidobacteriales bacterium]|nr:hypothetical protein [Bifidobacteriales bacterium]
MSLFCARKALKDVRGILPFCRVRRGLPEGRWVPQFHPQAQGQDTKAALEELILGFCLGAYQYHLKGAAQHTPKAQPKLCIAAEYGREARLLARAAWLGRDLIN